MTPEQMVSAVKKLAVGWEYDRVSIGYPGFVRRGQVEFEPHNLGPGWVGFNFGAAFGCPVKLLNDAAMQALGSYQGGCLLFLGFGTGLGSALVVEGVVIPMELGHLSYKDATFEHFVGDTGLKRLGRKRWQKHVEFGVARLIAGLHPDDVVLGGQRLTCRITRGFRSATTHAQGGSHVDRPSIKDRDPAPRDREDKHDSSTRGEHVENSAAK